MVTIKIGSQLFAQLIRNKQLKSTNRNWRKSYSIMSKPKVYVTRAGVPEDAINILKNSCEVTIWPKEEPVPRNELLKNIQGKDGLFCMLTDKIDKEVLDKAGPNLKIIGTMSVGYDHIDIPEVKQRNIKIGYTPNILTDATAELTLALLLATSRRLFEANRELQNGGWKAWAPTWMCGPALLNSTVGIVGFGRIGQQVARLLQPFKTKKILYHSQTDKPEAQTLNAKRTTFPELLSQSDFIIVTCALTNETRHMFNESAFAKMKCNCIFINTSRGDLVDQNALIKALEGNQIMAAGLDVMTPEPLPLDNPLLKLKNCVLLPHIGSATNETRNNMAILTVNNILAALENKEMPAEL